MLSAKFMTKVNFVHHDLNIPIFEYAIGENAIVVFRDAL